MFHRRHREDSESTDNKRAQVNRQSSELKRAEAAVSFNEEGWMDTPRLTLALPPPPKTGPSSSFYRLFL